jgi:hypothetical protein
MNLVEITSMKVVCAGGQVSRGDLKSVKASLAAALCCCTDLMLTAPEAVGSE